MRKRSFADALDSYFRLGNQLKQRDVQGVRKTVSGMLKLLFPDGSYSKDDVKVVLEYALKLRRRVKEQLKKLGGMEFYDVHFSYIDLETREESFVTLPEQSSGKLIENEPLSPGHVYSVTRGSNDMIGLYKVELQAVSGSGKLSRMGGASHTGVRDAINVAYNYFRANSNRVSGSINPNTSDYLLSLTDMQGAGSPDQVSLALLTAHCGAALGRSVQSQLALSGDITLGGTVTPVDNLASSLQVAFDCGAKRVLLPTANAVDIATVPGDLFAKFQTSFHSDPVDAGI